MIKNFFSYLYKIFNSFRKKNVKKELSLIDNLSDGWQFENYTANLLKKIGYSKVIVTSGSGDYGVDVLASKSGVTYAIQCKLYSSSVGNKAVQEIVSGKIYYNCDKAVVITNNYFTSAAQKLAYATGVELWDRSVLQQLIKQSGKFKNFKESTVSVVNPLTKVELSFDCDDIYLLDAINYSLDQKNISVSDIQRKFRVKYNYADYLISKMVDLEILVHDKNSHKYNVILTRKDFLLKYNKSSK